MATLLHLSGKRLFLIPMYNERFPIPQRLEEEMVINAILNNLVDDARLLRVRPIVRRHQIRQDAKTFP